MASSDHDDAGDTVSVSAEMRRAYELKRFPHAPPKLPKVSYPWRYRKPADEQQEWRNSVYYYWWEYIRRNVRYRLICDLFESDLDSALRIEHGERVTDAEITLYSHFGNVFAADFLTWWATHYQLFTDDVLLVVSVREGDTGDGQEVFSYLSEQIDRVTIGAMVRKAQFFHGENNCILIRHRVSRAKYRTAMRYVLPNLQTHLDVWDMTQAKPTMPYDAIADALNLQVSDTVNGETLHGLRELDLPHADVLKVVRRRKQLVVQRHLRIAEQYVRNVMLGCFPLRTKR